MYALNELQLIIQNHLVLDKVSGTIGQGEFIYLTGKSGVGKSMLLKVLYGLCPEYSGRCQWNHQEIKSFSDQERDQYRKQLAYMYQENFFLSAKTVAEQILYPVTIEDIVNPEREEKMNQLLERLNLLDKKNKRIAQLSGGEQQRVKFIRTLLKASSVLLLDEPTAQLDPRLCDTLAIILEEENKQGKTIIMATHDERVMEKFPKKEIKLVERKDKRR